MNIKYRCRILALRVFLFCGNCRTSWPVKSCSAGLYAVSSCNGDMYMYRKAYVTYVIAEITQKTDHYSFLCMLTGYAPPPPPPTRVKFHSQLLFLREGGGGGDSLSCRMTVAEKRRILL